MANAAWMEVCGITLSGTHVPDARVIFNSLTGWDGLTSSRGGGDSIPGDHGVFFRRSKILRSERAISVKGWILADSRSELLASLATLTAAFDGAGEMTVSDSSGQWTRWVEVDDFEVDDSHARNEASFTLDMVAPDPRRYGPLQTVGPISLPTVEGGVRFPQRGPFNFGRVSDGGRLIVTNAGSLTLMPRLFVSGGFTSVTVTDINVGRSLRLVWPVSDGETVVFDHGTRRAELSGSELTRWMARRQWFEVPPGETHEFRFEAAGVTSDPQMWAEYKIGAW